MYIHTRIHTYREVPANYVETYKHYARQGARVLALGWKPMESMMISKLRALHRDDVEKDFVFAGGPPYVLICVYVCMYVCMYVVCMYVCICVC